MFEHVAGHHRIDDAGITDDGERLVDEAIGIGWRGAEWDEIVVVKVEPVAATGRESADVLHRVQWRAHLPAEDLATTIGGAPEPDGEAVFLPRLVRHDSLPSDWRWRAGRPRRRSRAGRGPAPSHSDFPHDPSRSRDASGARMAVPTGPGTSARRARPTVCASPLPGGQRRYRR